MGLRPENSSQNKKKWLKIAQKLFIIPSNQGDGKQREDFILQQSEW